jgi:hypothetical protein
LNGVLWCLLAVAVLFVATFTVVPSVAYQVFQYRTRESLVLGKTEAEVIAIFGTPENRYPQPHGGVDLIFYGACGSTCCVQIRGGHASSVEHWQK